MRQRGEYIMVVGVHVEFGAIFRQIDDDLI